MCHPNALIYRKGMVIIMKHLFEKKTFLTMIAIIMLAGVFMLGNTAKVSAATRKCHTINNYNTRVYSNTALTRGMGWIYPSDECYVSLVTGRYSKVSYPTARGRRTGYISTSAILTATGGDTYTSKGKFNTYMRDGGSYYGYVAVGDRVMVLGSKGNYIQIKYPVSGGYKYAFATASDVNTYVLSQSNAAIDNDTSISSDVTTPNGTVQQNIYNLAQASVGTNGRIYQRWYGAGSLTPYCAMYATYIARTAMANAGYSTPQINAIVPKYASTSLWAKYYMNKGRYYSFASWYNHTTGVKAVANTSTASYTPQVGDLAAIDNYGDITPDHTGIVIAVNGNSLTMAEGNTGSGTNATRTVKIYTYYRSASHWYRADYSRAHVIGFANPGY